MTDLNPNDGITPGLTWTSTDARVNGYHDGTVFDEFGDASVPLDRNCSSGADVIAAGVKNGATFGSALLSASFHGDGSTGDTSAASARSNFGFTLSAGTAVTFYQDYAMSVSSANRATCSRRRRDRASPARYLNRRPMPCWWRG
ncbi:hypothetical protein [Duganella vulcania]|uniref:hypothetical protein n=1 Tax=Duganella vulcania TaxID=2692166 RepID=UPI0020C50C6D|nr:hypothetical protein [Duganella vulcania]